MGFKDKMDRLEAIVNTIDNADLETSIQYYEEGVKLIHECEGILKDIKQKVSLLTEDDQEKPFEEEDNE